MINFENIEEIAIPEFRKGKGETKMKQISDGKTKIMQVTLEPGNSIGKHTHDTNCEVMHIISGVASCTLNGEDETVLPGQAHYCPKGSEHSVENKGSEPLVMFAVVAEQ